MTASDTDDALQRRMARLKIHEDDLEEQFTRGTGAGGQKINKTSSTVRIKHLPSNIEVRCQEERSLSQNRYLARLELCEKLEQRKRTQQQLSRAAIARRRRQQTKRSRATKATMVREKRQRSSVKNLRKRPSSDD